uniref:NADH dehydrogenase subunit 9 n=1 Tax=Sulcionema specki TaxID=2016126 RepID=A0A6G5ZV69_9EUGL|nr:NADH dehydrogenase subunit 9 [Sulcionema specki]
MMWLPNYTMSILWGITTTVSTIHMLSMRMYIIWVTHSTMILMYSLGNHLVSSLEYVVDITGLAMHCGIHIIIIMSSRIWITLCMLRIWDTCGVSITRILDGVYVNALLLYDMYGIQVNTVHSGHVMLDHLQGAGVLLKWVHCTDFFFFFFDSAVGSIHTTTHSTHTRWRSL